MSRSPEHQRPVALIGTIPNAATRAGLALLTSLALLLSAFSGVYAFDPPSVEVPSGLAPETTFNAAGPGTVHDETGAPGQDLYIVLHQAPSLAQYRGEVAGLAATSPAETGARKLDTKDAASVAYLGYLATQHANLEVVHRAGARPLGRGRRALRRGAQRHRGAHEQERGPRGLEPGWRPQGQPQFNS